MLPYNINILQDLEWITKQVIKVENLSLSMKLADFFIQYPDCQNAMNTFLNSQSEFINRISLCNLKGPAVNEFHLIKLISKKCPNAKTFEIDTVEHDDFDQATLFKLIQNI